MRPGFARHGVWVLLVVLGLGLGAGEPAPRLFSAPNAQGAPSWRLSGLPAVLDEPAVAEHLTTGLTTTFLFRASTRGAEGERIIGGAQVQVRYELWDEVFHVAALGIDGRIERRTLESLDALATWWASLELLVLDSREVGLGGRGAVKLVLEIVPFSSAEQRDAQRWFSESLERRSRSNAEEVAESAGESPEQLERAINLLLATSIQRRALATFHWTVERPAATPEMVP